MNLSDVIVLVSCAIFVAVTIRFGFLNLLKYFIFLIIALIASLVLINPFLSLLYKLGWSENIYTPMFLAPFLVIVVWGVLSAVVSFHFPKLRQIWAKFLAGAIGVALALTMIFYSGILLSIFGENNPTVGLIKNSNIIRSINNLGFTSLYREKLLNIINSQLIKSVVVSTPSNEIINIKSNFTSSSLSENLAEEDFKLINIERERAGVAALARDSRLDKMASDYGREIIKYKRLSHMDENGVPLLDRAKSYGISFDYVGENLALAPSIELAHQGFMASQNHKENILLKAYRHAGVAVLDLSPSGKLVVEEFTN